jgi:signal transduction histidine kinase/ligand-binding sensor domain-containing protein/DNA-binding response OmpR family regulator
MRSGRQTYKLALIVLSIVFPGILRAGDNPPVKYLGIEQGLSNNAVTCVYQDEKGFMWFGTYDGLNKYDGYSFTIYRNVIGDNNSLTCNNVATIEGDRQHNIWVGGQKGLNIFNPITATFSIPFYLPCNGGIPVPARDNTHIIKAVGDSYILVGTHSSGLLVFDQRSRQAVQVPLPEPSGQKGNYDVPAIEYDPIHKTIWVSINNKGLYTYDPSARKLQLVSNFLTDANCLRTDRQGRLWVGTDNGLYLLDSARRSWSANRIPQRFKVSNICSDSRNGLWIASDGEGVWRLPPGAAMAAPLLSPAGAPLVNSNAVTAICEDGDGRKWIGTLRGGINVIESKTTSFKTITYDPPGRKNIVNNFILSFCEDLNHDVWVGTDGAGLRCWNRKKNTFTEYLNDPSDPGSVSSNFITGILRDVNNEIWVSTWFGGINRFNRATRRFQRFACFNPQTNAEEKHTWLLYEDKQKRLWAAATNDGCLYLFNRTANRFELFDDRIVNLQSLVEDNKGDLWGGNYSSLIRIDRENKNHRTYTVGYPVRCLHEDSNGQFWVGTQEGGLLLFDRSSGKFQRFTTAEGLPSNTVLRILEDQNGNLWLSTFNGLSKFNLAKRTCRNFSPSDGLQSAQFSFNAGIRLTSGELLFGGIKGFNIFFPDSIGDVKQSPNVYLTRVRIRNTPIETSNPFVTKRADEQIQELTLPFDQAMVSVDFTALEYAGTDKINYAYTLIGWDKGWNYSNGSRTANYSSIREGRYFFEVKVSHADGTWSKEKQILHLVILPPWYRTWWAYLLYIGCVAGLFLLYVNYTRSKERLRYEVKLAHLETEKEKELIERKLSFFTHITHEFRTPLTLIINPVKELLAKKDREDQAESLPFVYRNAQRLLSLVDQLLLFRKTESGSDELKPMLVDLVELSREVYLCFVQGARAKKIDYRFESADTALPLYLDREKIEIALYNLLSNALKYTREGGNVVFSITEKEEVVLIEVKDDGLGIPAEIGVQLFDKFYQINRKETASISGFGIGLYLVKQFVLAHKGKISYHSEPGIETSFLLELRKGKEHLGELTICQNKEGGSALFQEIAGGSGEEKEKRKEAQLISDLNSLLIVDDDPQLLSYVSQIFEGQFVIFKAGSGEEGLLLAQKHRPDLVIADVHMGGISGIELCETIKNDPLLSQTPVILLTAAASANSKLEGVKHGADDYITKPFDKELLMARAGALLKSRNRLQRYFYNEITLRNNPVRISEEYKEFLNRCIAIVEKNLGEDDFTIKKLCLEIGMSHSNLYQKVKDISGQSVNSFIRFIRLRKAAELFINTDCNVNEAAMQVGVNDGKYFREQFHKLFGLNPSEYIKKYRKVFSGKYLVNKDEFNAQTED